MSSSCGQRPQGSQNRLWHMCGCMLLHLYWWASQHEWGPGCPGRSSSSGEPHLIVEILKQMWEVRSVDCIGLAQKFIQPDSLGIPSPFVGYPGWEAWFGAQNLHNSRGTSLLLFWSLWVTHPMGMGFDFTVVAHFFFDFGGSIFFWWVPASFCLWWFNS